MMNASRLIDERPGHDIIPVAVKRRDADTSLKALGENCPLLVEAITAL
jgi:hypothetical protein